MRQTWRWFGPPDRTSVDDMLQAGAEGVVGKIEALFGALGETTLESTVDGIQLVGLDGMLDRVVSAQPEVARRTPGGYVIDYGEGTVLPDGSVRSGATGSGSGVGVGVGAGSGSGAGGAAGSSNPAGAPTEACSTSQFRAVP